MTKKPIPVDIRSDHWELVCDILRKHVPGWEVLAFGSRAKWTAKDYSDLDLAIKGDTPLPANIKYALSDAFSESILPFKVDVVDWAASSPSFREIIARDSIVAQAAWEEKTPDGWRKVSFDKAVEINPSVDLKKGNAYPFVDMQTIEAGNKHVVALREREFKNSGSRFISGDTLMARITPCLENGKIGRYRADDNKPAHGSTEFIVLRHRDGVTHPEFVYYLTISNQVKSYAITQMTGSSGRQRVPVSSLKHLVISLPTLPEQKTISSILKSFDDKIELNQKMNQTLEETAKAIFKSWFVDFDPVHAKAALRNQQEHQTTNHSPLEGESAKQGRSPQERRWGDVKRQYTTTAKKNASTLRKNQTNAENLLWYYLRNKQLDGHKFRRQQPIGNYIVDFACMPQKLIVELDGGQHAEQEARDKKRDAWLHKQGYRILRFWNNDVIKNCYGVLESIYLALGGSLDVEMNLAPVPPPHQPSPNGSASAPPQGGSNDSASAWTVERARAYLDHLGPEIAALFPDSFADSDIGKIPNGTSSGRLGDLVSFQNGYAFKGTEWNVKGSIPVIKIGNVKPLLVDTDSCSKVSESSIIGLEKFLLQRGDILVGMTGYVGEIGMVPERPFMPYLNQRVGKLSPIIKSDKSFILSLCRDQAFKSRIEEKATGSAQANVSGRDILGLPLALPSDHLRSLFDDIVSNKYDKILKNEFENSLLTNLRDTLLPKLISGKIRVPEIKHSLKESA
ncbi:MAG: DUF559 domain-containing protein [Pseudohongiellaceae bacterium]